MTTPKIAVIIGSTRDSRFADIPAAWIKAQAEARGDMQVELVDLRDFDLPLFNEVASNAWAPSQSEAAQAWQRKIGTFDGYIFVVSEYNRSITGALKNALDQAYVEWARKPFTVMGYGSMGATSATQHLRTIGVELQMVPTRNAVHIGGSDFFKVHSGFGGSGNLADIEGAIGPSATAALDDLVWWARATMAARASEVAEAA